MFFKTQELLKQALEMFCQYSQSSPCDHSCNLPAPAMTIRRLFELFEEGRTGGVSGTIHGRKKITNHGY